MTVPRHVAVIMDGNRRFSRRLMAKPWKGHEWGAEKVESFLRWCGARRVQEVTLYAFSIQNFDRPADEFAMLMRVFLETFAKLEARISAGDAEVRALRIRFIGRRERFPVAVQDAMAALERVSAAGTGMVVNVAMGYGGREEVIDAVRALARDVAAGTVAAEAVDEAALESRLGLRSEPDLIIRTGGEHRTSNFLIWQSTYAEWVFLEKTWPEIEEADVATAFADYSARERRFGK